ncbi:4'-phosphopantetheinyl transferase family protein [Streptomyces sp. NPDC101165]|uniref:4'-phosphopantetheinyl transferase family protein n=1 Tax=Streptomyces sp. NPDC101165 TaxID=3366119 RepID=UPI00381A8DF0
MFDPADLDVLSAEERRRFAAIRDRVRAAYFGAAHAEVRRRLAGVLGVGPEEIRFGRLPCPGCGRVVHGRPYVRYPETTWEFSLSRSGPRWLCAAADGVRIGVDLERVRRADFASLAPAVLSRGERRYFGGVPAVCRDREFMRCWTRKEAVVKASGIGVEGDLRKVEVGPDSPVSKVSHTVPGLEIGAWIVMDLPSAPHYSSALAVQDSEKNLVFVGGE